MIGPVFVDTNVLVYARDASEREKQPKAQAWMTHLWRARTGRLSMQVLHELYVTVTQKLTPGLDRAAARREVRDLLAWSPVPLDTALLESAWELQDRHRLSWWDSLIVAAAVRAQCRYLLTEDFADHARLGTILVVNPFLHPPDSVT